MKLAVVSARLALGVAAIVVLLVGALPATANTSGTGVVISQVYGGGGNSGSTYTNDFIELYNPTAVGGAADRLERPVRARRPGRTGRRPTSPGSIPAGGYYLVQEAQGAGGTTPLPTPNATGTIAMAAGAGKVVLLSTNTLTTAGTACPSSRVDLVGYGTGTNCFEGVAPAPTISASTSDLRAGNGATDTDSNGNDFAAGAPEPAELGHRSEPLDRRRLAERGRLRHDVVHVHGQPLRAGRRGRRHVRHRDGRRHCGLADRLHGEVADGADDPGEQLELHLHGPRQRRHDDGAAESFFVNVTNVTGATVADAQGKGTILDDDVDVCAQPYTPIYAIQGSGADARPITGTRRDEGVVVGDYEGPSPRCAASTSRTRPATATPPTSDGIFVFNNNNDSVSARRRRSRHRHGGGIPGSDADQPRRRRTSPTAAPALGHADRRDAARSRTRRSPSGTRGCSSACRRRSTSPSTSSSGASARS